MRQKQKWTIISYLDYFIKGKQINKGKLQFFLKTGNETIFV